MALKMSRLTVTVAEIIELIWDLASMQMRLSQIILLIFISLITRNSENYYEEGIVEIS